ncbi:MAG: YeeE/YedE thiosulfate transporter family protein [Planctomycetota bacterium]
MLSTLLLPWPWYVCGPLIGLMVPALLVLDNRRFGVSSSFRHLCAALLNSRLGYLRYDWRAESWNLWFVGGMALGGWLAARVLAGGAAPAIAPQTIADLRALGIAAAHGPAPTEIFSWPALLTARGLLVIVGGGFLVGFGTRYANGCTSGHAISGMANLEWPSLLAVLAFFAGGLLVTHVVYRGL